MLKSLAFSLLLLGLAAPGVADTLKVPTDFQTIQAAVDAAVPGDLINVGSGSYTENVVIAKSGITLKGSKSAVISGGGVPLTITGADDVTITGFTLNGGNPANLAATSSNRLLITKVRMQSGPGFGIDILGGDGVQIVKNTISGVALDCIEIDDVTGGLVSANKLTGCGANGIDVTSVGMRIEKNKVASPDRDGLSLRGSEIAIKNKVTLSGDDGIATSGTGATLEANKVTSAGDDGFDVDGANGTFVKNSVKIADSDGFQITGPGNTFTANKVRAAGDNCIEVSVGAGAQTLTANQVSTCGDFMTTGDGFRIDTPSNTLVGNKASKVTDNCFRITTDSNELTQNKASRCVDGFSVVGVFNVFSLNSSKALDDDLRDFNPDEDCNPGADTNSYTGNKFPNKNFGPAGNPDPSCVPML